MKEWFTEYWPMIVAFGGSLLLFGKHLKSFFDGLFSYLNQSISIRKAKLDLQIQQDELIKERVEAVLHEYRQEIKDLVAYLEYAQPFLTPECKTFSQWKAQKSS